VITVQQRIAQLKTQIANVGEMTIEARRDWVNKNVLPGAIQFAPEREVEMRAEIEDDNSFERLWKERELQEAFVLWLGWKIKELEIWESVKRRHAA
jgi:hypothetical protein